MVLTCKLLKFKFNILKRPVFTGLFLFFSFLLNDIFASDLKAKVEKIEIIGLDKTKRYIIEREIFHPIDTKLDSSFS